MADIMSNFRTFLFDYNNFVHIDRNILPKCVITFPWNKIFLMRDSLHFSCYKFNDVNMMSTYMDMLTRFQTVLLKN